MGRLDIITTSWNVERRSRSSVCHRFTLTTFISPLMVMVKGCLWSIRTWLNVVHVPLFTHLYLRQNPFHLYFYFRFADFYLKFMCFVVILKLLLLLFVCSSTIYEELLNFMIFLLIPNFNPRLCNLGYLRESFLFVDLNF